MGEQVSGRGAPETMGASFTSDLDEVQRERARLKRIATTIERCSPSAVGTVDKHGTNGEQ